ncbi:NrfD/PsrC family molybdoenzyme membrane anchor subunit [Aliivibrio fischeri]|uniref:NrfD/PsrC family molybdoenzyme membrane anchor subunit n=1 Tax=Aliivibrio fischeri TaxID=668 RepID=UPI0012DA2F27|nr:NrfD/PsrC family molybdoenzyme membrane anchor subunit [Aliivibrio fischeri]MUJ36733.1 tetrathionate reductase [Aliivibrio fischeri]
MNITEVLVQPQATAWLPWAVQYFLYIGSAYAAAILFLISLIFQQHTSHRLRSAFVLVLAIGAIVGPLALTGDLHQPGRAWHFFFHLTPWSWMSLGSLFLPLFSALAVLTAWLYLRDDIAKLKNSNNPMARFVGLLTLGDWKISTTQMKAVAFITVISGLSIALYTGAEIAIVESRPLWNQAASPLLWFITAFLASIGFTGLLLFIFPSEKTSSSMNDSSIKSGDLSLVKRVVTISSILAFILIPLWASNNPTFSLYENSDWVTRLSILSLSFMACFLSAQYIKSLSRMTVALVSIITLCSSFYLRWVTMMNVQTIPKFDVGAYPYELPMGGSGLLGIIGMFGLWVALALAVSEIINTTKSTK